MSTIANRIINIDEYLAKKFAKYSKNESLRKSLLVFEYIFHGVPWFLIVISSCFLFDDPRKAVILFAGNIFDIAISFLII